MLRSPRLMMDFQPVFMAGYALRLHDKSHWERRVRPAVVPKSQPSCSICGFIAETNRRLIHADEVWAFPGPPKVVLTDVRPLCVYCHDAKDYAGLLRRITAGAAAPSLATKIRAHYCTVNECITADFDGDLLSAKQRVRAVEDTYDRNVKPDVDYGRWARPPDRPLMTDEEKETVRQLLADTDEVVVLSGVRLANYQTAIRHLQSLTLDQRRAALVKLFELEDDDWGAGLTERDEGIQWD